MKKPTDSQRLNWLEENNARLQNEAEDEHSLPHAVVYLPTLEDGESTWKLVATGDDFREAIDRAMESMAREIEADNEAQRAEDIKALETERLASYPPAAVERGRELAERLRGMAGGCGDNSQAVQDAAEIVEYAAARAALG
jgi:hypothetical protein